MKVEDLPRQKKRSTTLYECKSARGESFFTNNRSFKFHLGHPKRKTSCRVASTSLNVTRELPGVTFPEFSALGSVPMGFLKRRTCKAPGGTVLESRPSHCCSLGMPSTAMGEHSMAPGGDP